jgi:hypothetical protein
MDWVYVDADKIVKITDKAMLVLIDGQEVWLPLSQLHEVERYAEGDEDITIAMSDWLAKQKGLEGS